MKIKNESIEMGMRNSQKWLYSQERVFAEVLKKSIQVTGVVPNINLTINTAMGVYPNVEKIKIGALGELLNDKRLKSNGLGQLPSDEKRKIHGLG